MNNRSNINNQLFNVNLSNFSNKTTESNFYEYDESNPSNLNDDQINACNPLEILQQIRIDNEQVFDDDEPNKELIHSALLALFFAGNFTQSSFKLILEFTRLWTKVKIPTKFDQLLKTLSDENIEYTKTWFCHICQTQVELSHSTQRFCSTCKNQ